MPHVARISATGVAAEFDADLHPQDEATINLGNSEPVPAVTQARQRSRRRTQMDAHISQREEAALDPNPNHLDEQIQMSRAIPSAACW